MSLAVVRVAHTCLTFALNKKADVTCDSVFERSIELTPIEIRCITGDLNEAWNEGGCRGLSRGQKHVAPRALVVIPS